VKHDPVRQLELLEDGRGDLSPVRAASLCPALEPGDEAAARANGLKTSRVAGGIFSQCRTFLTPRERCAHDRRTAAGLLCRPPQRKESAMESLLGGGLFALFLAAQALAVVALQEAGQPASPSN
jgi:hypothetical protein